MEFRKDPHPSIRMSIEIFLEKICKKDEPLTEEILSKIPLLKASVKENLRFLFIQVFSLTSVN